MGLVMDVAAEASPALRKAVAAVETAQAGSASVILGVTSIAWACSSPGRALRLHVSKREAQHVMFRAFVGF
eukprot:160541-Chlamydomonas_euryale.AAC.1